ncbi:MAG: DUF3300 domain-containing protein [Deltaproteobacteria bacterium]|nr:DUF3300 domain-containing protein [Deltaproteobacteria bacterium]
MRINSINLKRVCSSSLRACVLAWALCGATTIPSAQAQDSFFGTYQPLSTQALNNLVAPVALYPDPLLAQLFPAATHPDQIAAAASLIANNPGTNQIANQGWDPSVVAIAQYPTVLNRMNQNYNWTNQIGQAYLNQQAGIFAAVQYQRQLAQNAGNLMSNAQLQVINQGNSIVILPASPTMLYVPVYDPNLIYTQPTTYSTTPLMAFATGVAIGSTMNSTVNWGSSTIVYNTGGSTGWYSTPSGGWAKSYYGSGAYGYGAGTTTTGTGAWGNQWKSTNASGGTWNGGSWAGHGQSNQWANGAQTGSFSVAGAGPNGAASARGWGYDNGDDAAGGFSKTVATQNGIYNVHGAGATNGTNSYGGVQVSGVNRDGNYGSQTWTNNNGNYNSSRTSGNVFGGVNNGGWSNSYADRGAMSRSSDFSGYGGGGFGGGGFGGGGFRGGFRR